MSESYMGFDLSKVVIGVIRLMKQKGLLQEDEILDLLWEAKDAHFPWTREDIKELIKL